MATVSWHVPTPNKNFVRARCKGFVLGVGSSNTAIVGNFLEFDYLFPLYHGHLKIQNYFQAPNSNVYSPDYVFDASLSTFTLSGTPIDALVYLDLVFVPDDQHYRINVLSNVGFDPLQEADLVPLAGYWNPPYP